MVSVALAFLKNYKIFIVLAIVISILGTVSYKSYSYGYDKASIKYERILNEEAQRALANYNRAVAEVKAKLEEQEKINSTLEETIRINNNEATKDSRANSPSISIGGVQRLNKIR